MPVTFFALIHTQNLFYSVDVGLRSQVLQKSQHGCVPIRPHLSSPAVPLPFGQNPEMKNNRFKVLIWTV